MRALLMFAGMLLWAAQSRAEFLVAGTVVNGVSRQAVKKADVVLMNASGDKESRYLTGPDGRFSFRVPEGRYHLTADAPGIYRQGFGGRVRPVEIGVSVYVKPGQDTEHLELLLFPPGSIRGRILDQAGDPVESALVQLYRAATVVGKREVIYSRSAYTNDLGEYGFGQLPAATYYLAVSGVPWYSDSWARRPAGEANAAEPRDAFRTMFYPGVFEASAATPLTIRFGQDFQADMSLTTTQGRAVTIECKGHCSQPMVALIIGESVAATPLYQRVERMVDATARFASVPTGHYKVRLRGADGRAGYFGTSEFDVAGRDVSLPVESSGANRISGMVSMEGGAQGQLTKMLVRIKNLQEPQQAQMLNVSADGKFQSPLLLPGRYQIFGVGIPNGYMKSVRVGEKESRILDVTAEGLEGVRVVVSTNPAHVKGMVLQDGKPVYGAMVSLSREGAVAGDADYLRGFQTDSDGSFSFDTLVPGKYFLFAVFDASLEYANPAALQPYLANARVLELAPGDRFSEKLDVVSPPKQ